MLSEEEAAKIITRYVERYTNRVLQGAGMNLRVYGYTSSSLPEELTGAIVTAMVEAFIIAKLSISARCN